MPGVKCEISLNLIWSENYVISSATGQTKFVIADTKLYVLVVTLSTENNMKLSKQLESGFKRKINWDKYFDYLIDGNFQRINRLFVLSFKNRTNRKVHTKHYIPKVEIKDYNAISDGRNFFDQAIKNDLKKYDNIMNITTGQGDDYTTSCLLDFLYFEENYKLTVIYLSKQQSLDTDPKAMQQIN